MATALIEKIKVETDTSKPTYVYSHVLNALRNKADGWQIPEHPEKPDDRDHASIVNDLKVAEREFAKMKKNGEGADALQDALKRIAVRLADLKERDLNRLPPPLSGEQIDRSLRSVQFKVFNSPDNSVRIHLTEKDGGKTLELFAPFKSVSIGP